MRLPGPFDIETVADYVSRSQPPDFLLRDVRADEFAVTRTARDPRFVAAGTGNLVMSFHSFVVRTPRGILLVDTCVGNHKDRPIIPEWHQQEFPYLERLAAAGVTPEQVDVVCCTHLHGDHVGWNTRLHDGRWVPTFPNARYLMAEAEVRFWEDYHAGHPGDPYWRPWEDSVLPVMAAGLVERVASDHEIVPGIRLSPAPGHTPGNVILELNDGRRRAVLSGDVIHHPVQIERWQWSANFDADPEHARRTRRSLLEQLADTDVTLMPAHFPDPTAMRVVSEGDGFFYRDA